MTDWIARFENMATINGWDGEAKLNWTKACLAGRTQKAFQVYQRHHKVITREQRTALTERFKLASKLEPYNAQLQVRTKRHNKGWADFAKKLRHLTEKSFPELDAKNLALTHYLSHLTNPQVAFLVKQQHPKKLKAVCATLEVESYLLKPAVVGSVNPDVDEFTVGATSSTNGAVGRMPQSSEQNLM